MNGKDYAGFLTLAAMVALFTGLGTGKVTLALSAGLYVIGLLAACLIIVRAVQQHR